MTDARGDELLAAIRAAPDDRALRLVYADWLQERGDPRGEWIALSCGQATEDTTREMRRRALWQAYGQRWEAEDSEASGLRHITYRDGFPDSAILALRAHAAPRFDRHPLRILDVRIAAGVLATLTNAPILETVRDLRLSGATHNARRAHEDELAAFLNAPALRGLEGIAIRSTHRAHTLWPALARFERVAELKRLELHMDIGVEQARWLARACPALEELTCGGIMSDAALRALLETATFRLRTLRLFGESSEAPSDATLGDALAAPLTSKLTSLALDSFEFGTRTASAIERLPCAATLRQLHAIGMGDATIVHGLGGARLPALEALGIEDAGVTDDLVGIVARFPTLTALDLDLNDAITDRGAERIMSSLPRLARLSLAHTSLGNDGAHAIARSERARLLQHLSLASTDLRRGALASIVGSGHLDELRRLFLQENPLDVADVRSLAGASFDRMAYLCVHHTVHGSTESLFKDGWIRSEPDTYERKLELSGRAVPHR